MIACSFCGKGLQEHRGRGGGRMACCQSQSCKRQYWTVRRRRQINKYRAAGLTAVGKPYKVRKKVVITQRALTTMTNRQWLRDEMFRRGKCAYHIKYFGLELAVHDDYIEVFEFDHIDRSLKTPGLNVSRMTTRAPLADLQAEVALCELVCSNCHQIKTRRNKDWMASDRVIQEHPQLTFE